MTDAWTAAMQIPAMREMIARLVGNPTTPAMAENAGDEDYGGADNPIYQGRNPRVQFARENMARTTGLYLTPYARSRLIERARAGMTRIKNENRDPLQSVGASMGLAEFGRSLGS